MYVWAIIVWLGLSGFYLFLAGDVSEAEIIACVVCATAGTALAVGLSWITHFRFDGAPPGRAIVRPLTALLPETFIVGRELLAAIVSRVDQRGAFVRQPFDSGSDDDPPTAGRRALVVLGVSLAPRTFVVRGETSDALLLHSLPTKAASPDRRWPA